MGSLDSILTRQGLAQNVVATVLDDEPVALRLKYVGTGTVTTVVLTTATDLELITSDATEEFLFSTYTNMGLLADAVNASAYWECKLLDALRTDETENSDFVEDLTLDANSEGYYDCLVDTDVAQNAGNDFIFTYRCAYDRNPDNEKPAGSHRVRLSEVNYNVNVNGVEAGGFQIWEWNSGKKTETLVYSTVSVDATEEIVNFASGNKTLDASIGGELIVRVKDTTSITDNDANALIVSYTRE